MKIDLCNPFYLATACAGTLLVSSADAGVIIETVTRTIEAVSVDNGASIAIAPGGPILVDGDNPSPQTITYTVSGLDLSSLEASAIDVSFDFSVTYTGSADLGLFNVSTGNGAVGISGGNATQVGAGETLTLSISDPANVIGFSGDIGLNGFTAVLFENFQGATDEANLTFSDGTSVDVVSTGVFSAQPLTGLVAANSVINSGIGGQHRVDNISLQFEAVAVPEPASMALLVFGGLTLLSRRRHNG